MRHLSRSRHFVLVLFLPVFFILVLSSRVSMALTTATVASSLTVTEACPIFTSAGLDYALKTSSGVTLYTGNLDTATWTPLGSAGGSSYARTIRCSRDSTGTTHSVYHLSGASSATDVLTYLTHTSVGSPTTAAVADATIVNVTPIAAAHDSADNFYALFSDTDTNYYYLAYREAASGTWTTLAVDTSGNIRNGDMILVDELPVVSLYDGLAGDVIVAKLDASLTTWTTETVASTGDVGGSISLDADANGALHLIYHNKSGGVRYRLEYATNASGTWTTEAVDSSDTYLYNTDIAAITPDLIAVTAFDYVASNAVYFTRTDAGWSSATTVGAARYQYLDMNEFEGNVAISYYGASSSSLSVSYSLCGDGSRSDFEECDDGNATDGDGCSLTCEEEAECGNGTVQTGEECDDGNTTDGDWCGSDCRTELAPIANAGADQTMFTLFSLLAPGRTVTLNGSLSSDPEGESLSFAWTMTSVPRGGLITGFRSSSLTTANIANANTASASFNPDVVGTYVLTLTVTDADGHSASDTVSIVVRRVT